MAEHWCAEHKTVFFKKGRMKGYAHPIKDANGNDTGEWCNEPEAAPAPQATPGKPFEPAINREKQASIEQQNARTNLTQLAIAGLLDEGEKASLIGQLCAIANIARCVPPGLVDAVKAAGGKVVKTGTKQFPNLGAFLNKCWTELKLQRPDVEAYLEMPVTDTTDFDAAWVLLNDIIACKNAK
jgi:hypothetical protein